MSGESLQEVRLRADYCPVIVSLRGRQTDRQTDRQKKNTTEVLLCHKAVNNVLGGIGVSVYLQRQTASQFWKDNFWKNDRV